VTDDRSQSAETGWGSTGPDRADGTLSRENSGAAGLPEAAYATALAAVTRIGPRRLRSLLDRTDPGTAWRSVVSGHDDDHDGRWRVQARGIDVGRLWAEHCRQGIQVLVRGDATFPASLADDPQSPAVIFGRGRMSTIDHPRRVTIVGTRNATRYGLGIAAQLASDLTASGVSVVSGLAPGIDLACHEGATATANAAGGGVDGEAPGPPLAVVTGGPGVPGGPDRGRLWRRVIDSGALIAEFPLGSAVPGWAFAQRNRILAAVAHVVVVVECHSRGGSLHTVRAAMQRGITVGAVPGSVRSPASAGTNDLLADGCVVIRDAADVMVALELARATTTPVLERRPRSHRRSRPAGVADRAGTGASNAGDGQEPPVDDPLERAVLDSLGWEVCSLEELLRRTGLPVGTASIVLERLRDAGRVAGESGWWEQV
jgi:DNA processing protein